MKLKREDNVIVITGKDKGKTGKVLSVIPAENKIIVEGVNIIKKATKPSAKVPRGGILEITKPLDASKVMVLDPATGKPARVGYTVKADGTKERIFKVSPNQTKKITKKADTTDKSEKAGKK
jgi:large subunit ribosomal protein L24